MQPFKTFRGIIAPLDGSNVDTDQIIPKQFLKSIRRTGFGESLFFDWRYLPNGDPDPAFSLNQPAVAGAQILLTRNNFGCGSSREHAVWAVMQYGFNCVIAPFRGEGDDRIPAFADIFRNNGVKNGLLTVELTEEEVETIFEAVAQSPGVEATVDLENQAVTLHTSPEQSYSFEVDPTVKDHLLRGLDDIALTLQYESAITAFEAKHATYLANEKPR